MRIARASFIAIAGLIVAASVATATRHLRLTDSLPKQDETVAESPSEVRVWFNQEVSMAVSRLGLEGPNGDVETGDALETDDPKSFTANVNEELAPGSYTVTWRTAGDDGHVQRGSFTFLVSAQRN